MQKQPVLSYLMVVLVLLGLTDMVNAGETNDPPTVSISQLLADKQKWKSRRVEIRGFHRTRVELSAIYSTTNELEHLYLNAKDGLWVNYGGSSPEVKVIRGGFVRIVGTFEFYPGQGCGHMGRWPAEITKLEIVELLHYPGSKGFAPPAKKEKASDRDRDISQ